MINVGLIGYGYWGNNLLRNFNSHQGAKMIMVSDSREARLDIIRKNHSSIQTSTHSEDVVNHPDIEAVVIATPVFTHYALAKSALLNGKHVLLEKPMTSSTKESEELIDLAKENGLTLMVDHTFLYTGAVQKLKQLISEGSIGNIKYFDSTRINLGLFQPDINVLWDLAPHDISILNYLVHETPYSVNATGVSHTNNDIENIAYMTVNYKSGFIAHFHCSWSSPVKIRTMLLGGDKKMMVYNDLEPTEKVKVYDTTYDYKSDEEQMKILVEYRTGDVYIPMLESREALYGMVNDFLNAIETKTEPVSSAASGLEVVRILEAAQQSIKQNGKEIILE